MEQHPVPRNISGFEFRLIGDMTLKQFGYLAGGAIISFLLYQVIPASGLVRWGIAILPFLISAALAFLPIQDRPLDKWLVDFLRSIFAPTQYFWQKHEEVPDILLRPIVAISTKESLRRVELHNDANTKLKSYLASLPPSPHQTLNNREQNYIHQTLSLFGPAAQPNLATATYRPSLGMSASSVDHTHGIAAVRSSIAQHPVVSSLPNRTAPTPAAEILKPPVIEPINPPTPSVQPTVEKLPQTQATLQPIQPSAPPPPSPLHNEYQSLNDELARLKEERERLNKELEGLRQKTTVADRPSVVKPQVKDFSEPTIQSIPAKSADKIGIPALPEYPNIVIGVIKDTSQSFLPSIIITIKDEKGMPLRALKSNKLGQFATATPLNNGTYYLEFEDPIKRYAFDIAQITLDGKIFLPIEITAKGKREILREQMSKELFGSN